jgi:hypothetical protein
MSQVTSKMCKSIVVCFYFINMTLYFGNCQIFGAHVCIKSCENLPYVNLLTCCHGFVLLKVGLIFKISLLQLHVS